MGIKQHNDYVEHLVTIANTRLIFNTLEQLEDFFDNHAIRSNGVRRAFVSPAKARGAFRDLKEEVAQMTNGNFSLPQLLDDYKLASDFHAKHLARRADPETLARQWLTYYFKLPDAEILPKRLQSLFKAATDEKIDPTLLTLLLIGALPGYNSKAGDVADINQQWGATIRFIDEFTKGCGGLFDSIPAVSHARDEENKTRLMLIRHVDSLLGIYAGYLNPDSVYETSADLTDQLVHLDIAGFWAEPASTNFWQIEETEYRGEYFATWWHKDSNNKMTGLRHTISLISDDAGRLVMYIQHPDAIRHRIQGKEYTDRDHTWYRAPMPDTDTPDQLPFTRCVASRTWKNKLQLSRVTDPATLAIYQKWLAGATTPRGVYRFTISLWAITQETLYIYDETDDTYYEVPRQGDHGFDRIRIDDKVGIITLDGHRYLAFDPLSLYLPLTPAALTPLGITPSTP